MGQSTLSAGFRRIHRSPLVFLSPSHLIVPAPPSLLCQPQDSGPEASKVQEPFAELSESLVKGSAGGAPRQQGGGREVQQE
jgi:hypothetical protein